MAEKSLSQKLIQFSKGGLWVSIPLAIILLILPFWEIISVMLEVPTTFKDLSNASPLFQTIVEGVITDSIGGTLEKIMPYILVIGGGILFLYSIIFGYLKTYRALDINSRYVNVKRRRASEITLSSTAVRSLIINLPVVYWAILLFVCLPSLVKLPISAISTGSIPVLVVVCIIMIIATVLITHIGVLITRISLRFMVRGN